VTVPGTVLVSQKSRLDSLTADRAHRTGPASRAEHFRKRVLTASHKDQNQTASYTPGGGRVPVAADLPGHAPEAKDPVAPGPSLSAQTHFPHDG
jgi:hypothetical protein